MCTNAAIRTGQKNARCGGNRPKTPPQGSPSALPWRPRSPRAWVLRVRGAATSASPPPVHPVRSAVGAGAPAGPQSTHRPPRCDRPEMGGQGTSASGGETGRAWPSARECPAHSLPACAPSGRWLLGCGASCRPQRTFSRPSHSFPSGTPPQAPSACPTPVSSPEPPRPRAVPSPASLRTRCAHLGVPLTQMRRGLFPSRGPSAPQTSDWQVADVKRTRARWAAPHLADQRPPRYVAAP